MFRGVSTPALYKNPAVVSDILGHNQEPRSAMISKLATGGSRTTKHHHSGRELGAVEIVRGGAQISAAQSLDEENWSNQIQKLFIEGCDHLGMV